MSPALIRCSACGCRTGHPVGAELVIDGGDLRHRCTVVVGHDASDLCQDLLGGFLLSGEPVRLVHALVAVLGVGAELAIHDGDLRHRWAVVVGHDHRSWRYDCCI
jgi:hypothetical protein